jgi:hypothetical protein
MDYGVDTILTIIHRIYLKENIFLAHRKHLFQLLVNELRLPHVFVSFLYAMIQLLIIIGLMVFKENGYLYLAVVIVILSLAYCLIKKKYYHLHQTCNYQEKK